MHPLPTSILFIGHDAALGGAQLALLDTIRHATAKGLRPIVIVPTSGPFTQALRAEDIKCYWGLIQRWIFFRKPVAYLLNHPYLWALVSLLTLPFRVIVLVAFAKLNRVRLIYTNTLTVIDGAFVARLLGIPHVWHLHEAVTGNTDLAIPWPTGWIPQFILAWSDRVIVNSIFLRNNIFGESSQGNIRIIYNGTDISAAQRRSPTHFPKLPANTPVTAIVGRLNENKGILDYLEAVVLLNEHFPTAHHLIVGDGIPEYVDFIKSEAMRMGLGDRVHFLGFQPDVPSLLLRIDVLVSTSHRESFGRTLIEAMAAGKPVVATRSGGPEEIVVEGECGYLVDVGNIEAIANRMARILGNPSLALALGNAGRQRAVERFDLAYTTQEIVRIVEEALSGQG